MGRSNRCYIQKASFEAVRKRRRINSVGGIRICNDETVQIVKEKKEV